jgi:GNAT superfamily N-acetyltransferase
MISFVERARASVEPLSLDAVEAWVAFQARLFGRDARQADRAWIRWAAQNPEIDSEAPPVLICRRDGAIVGSQSSVPFRLREGGAMVPASWAIDLMVEPAWRLRGVGPALTGTLTSRPGLVAALGVSDAAYRAFLRSGWRDLGELPIYIHPRDVSWSATQAGLRGIKGIVLKALTRPALELAGLVSGVLARAIGADLQAVPRFDQRVDEVWAVVDYPVMAARDFRALTWRFDAAPNADRCTRYYLVQRGHVRGYAVTRLEPVRGRPALVIVDFLASPRWILPLLARVAALPEARKAGAVICEALIPGMDHALVAAGFLRIGAGGGTIVPEAGVRFRIMVHQGDRPERAAFDRRRWFITTGDSDVGWGRQSDAES